MLDKIVLKGKEMQHLSDEEFFTFCQANPEINIERNSQREIIIMSPTGALSSNRNAEIIAQLRNWNNKKNLGIVFDSSGGFTLPDQSVKSPDASWLSHEKWARLTIEEKERFAPVCPEFVVELLSKTDRLQDLQHKMEEWIQNGVQLGWLIDPENEAVHVYQPQQALQTIYGFQQLISANPILPGFRLNLKKLNR